MDLSFLDKQSRVTPALVRLYDSQKLYGLANDTKPDARSELTDAVIELLEMQLSPRETELVADVLIELVRQAERDLRKTLSQRLAVMDNVPLRLVLQISNDEIEIARPILEQSSVLGDLDLLYIIKSKGAEYWQAIANRSHVSSQVVDALVRTGDEQTAVNVLGNTGARLSETAIKQLVDMACSSDALAKPLLQREEVGKDIVVRLYAHVGEALKAYIQEEFDITGTPVGNAVDSAIDRTVADLAGEAELNEKAAKAAGDLPPSEFLPTQSMIDTALNARKRGILTANVMMDTLRRGQLRQFIAQFAQYTELDPQKVVDVLGEPNGRSLAVLCRALGIQKPDFISMFLLSNRIRSGGRMVTLDDMGGVVEYFNNMDAGKARQMMVQITGREFR